LKNGWGNKKKIRQETIVQMNRQLSIRALAVLTLLLILGVNAMAGNSQAQVALQPGAAIPRIELKDQAGKTQTFDSLKGANGLLLILSRSADWCPYYKSQLIDFESSRKNFEAKGIRVASVTYDSTEILKTFAQRKNINFELLSDPDSKIIDAFGVRNLEVTGTQVGIAIPNYYLIGPDGVIRNRWEEETNDKRVTANYFYEILFGASTAIPPSGKIAAHAPHLNIAVAQSDADGAPGARMKLTVRLEPGTDTHVYAPGAETNGYRALKLTLDSSELDSTLPAAYPKSTILEFPALHEKVPVFESTTVVTQDVTPVRSKASLAEFSAHPDLVIRGSLQFQACTSTVCFPPEEIPVSWTLNVRAADLDTIRVPLELQRK
jgi:peroxiredoxin